MHTFGELKDRNAFLYLRSKLTPWGRPENAPSGSHFGMFIALLWDVSPKRRAIKQCFKNTFVEIKVKIMHENGVFLRASKLTSCRRLKEVTLRTSLPDVLTMFAGRLFNTVIIYSS